MVEPLTLVRFAELTARLEQSESRQAILDQEGVPLQHWLSEQRRWLEEMSKRIALSRPRLFRHYCALVEAERGRLGRPPLVGGPPSPTGRAPVAGTEITVSDAPDAPFLRTRSAGAEAPPAETGLSNAKLDVPDYLRATGPLASPVALPSRGFPDSPPVLGAPVPALPWSGAIEPRPVLPSVAVLSAERRAEAASPPLSTPPAPDPAVAEAVSRARSAPPQLQMSEYVELTVLLEQTSTGASVLSRFGLSYGEWVDEVAYWNRQFTEKRVDPKIFEQLLAIQRGKAH